MKLQLALDRMTIAEAVGMAESVREQVEWIEVGTSLIKEFGMESVRALRRAFPEKTLLADGKTFDNAKYEFELCYEAGADVATVMGAAPLVSVKMCLDVAKRYGKQVMIDLLNTSVAQREALAELASPAVIYCVHVSKDQQEGEGHAQGGAVPAEVTGRDVRLAFAGGISADSVAALAAQGAEVLIVGSAITKADSPREAAREIREAALR